MEAPSQSAARMPTSWQQVTSNLCISPSDPALHAALLGHSCSLESSCVSHCRRAATSATDNAAHEAACMEWLCSFLTLRASQDGALQAVSMRSW